MCSAHLANRHTDGGIEKTCFYLCTGVATYIIGGGLCGQIEKKVRVAIGQRSDGVTVQLADLGVDRLVLAKCQLAVDLSVDWGA